MREKMWRDFYWTCWEQDTATCLVFAPVNQTFWCLLCSCLIYYSSMPNWNLPYLFRGGWHGILMVRRMMHAKMVEIWILVPYPCNHKTEQWERPWRYNLNLSRRIWWYCNSKPHWQLHQSNLNIGKIRIKMVFTCFRKMRWENTLHCPPAIIRASLMIIDVIVLR